VTARIPGSIALLGCALALAGCSGAGKQAAAIAAAPRCAHAAGWQRLAQRIAAPVYCPAWLPDPLVGQVGGRWNNIDSVSRDRSYLEGFVWQETGGGAAGGELHVNLRAYPGVTTIPTCVERVDSAKMRLPCFADAKGTKRAPGIVATMYTVNQDADQWHVLYAWRHAGSLYTVSEHVAPPLNFAKVVANLDRILRTLVLVEPRG
jgi:hypothetical protein